MANYYRKFIEGFSKISDPLNALFASCDASDTAVGYTLGQKTKDNKEVVIAYGGKSLTKEENIQPLKKSCLLLFEEFKPIVNTWPATSLLSTQTIYKALIWLKTAKHTGRLEVGP